MQTFMDENFLLESRTAEQLFHGIAEKMPIIDYHCHLPAREIYENLPMKNLTALWLGDDHYKWRAMRANGIPEEKITGNASDWEKFEAYARTVPYAIGNPLYHWTHMELQRYFGIHEILKPSTAQSIYRQAEAVLSDGSFTPQSLIQRSSVEVLCTTDDPADDLQWHRRLRDESDFPVRVLPAYRPEQAMFLQRPMWRAYIGKLSEASGIRIRSARDVMDALMKCLDAFQALGCVATDHAVDVMYRASCDDREAEKIFLQTMEGTPVTQEMSARWSHWLLHQLAVEYKKRDLVMEIHIGCLRNANSRGVREIGTSKGFDAIDDRPVAQGLGAWMDELAEENSIPKMILFNLHPKDTLTLSALAGSFESAECASPVQIGPAWWFLDHLDGMEAQLKTFASSALLGRFLGMLTDSRSYLSYTRHEYFRRLFCNLIGQWVESGKYPADQEMLETIVRGVCYENVKAFFKL